MKPAEVDDVWRRLRAARNRRIGSIYLAWSAIPKLSDGRILIDKPFSLICGENGAGKSTLLKRLFHSIVPAERRLETSVYSGLEEGCVEHLRIELGHGPDISPQTMVQPGAVHDYFAPSGDALRAALFDPAMHVPLLVQAISRDPNFSEVLEPFEPRELGASEIADVSYVVGRDYDRVLIYEVDGLADMGTFPYFQVRVGGVDYASETMGFGELSLLLGYWFLSRMQPGSLVLMEEPETFVSPRSQRRFADLAARFALKCDLKILATTHSPAIVSRFLEEEITLLSRAGNAVTLHSPAPRVALESRLELVVKARHIWFVEDALAARVATFLGSEVPAQVSVFVAGDNNAVVALATAPRPHGFPNVRFFGLLDGDERARGAVAPNIGFLPSQLAPDAFVRQLLSSAPRDEMALFLGVTAPSLELAMGSVAGLDHHEVLHTIRRELEISLDQLVNGALRWWALNRADEMQACIDDIMRL